MMHGEGMLCWSDDFGVCRYKAQFLILSVAGCSAGKADLNAGYLRAQRLSGSRCS